MFLKFRKLIVGSSRFPPRPHEGHEARGCRTAAEGSGSSSWELFEVLWRALGGSLTWGRLGRAGGGPGGVLAVLGWVVLEAYERRLGGSLGRLEAVLGALEAMLEPSGSQKAPKMEPGRVPNRGPETIRTINLNSSKTFVFALSFNDF